MSCLIVIPARWGSTRLPGKPLIPLMGRPLLARVVDLVRHAISDLTDIQLTIATDDQRVAALAEQLNCPVAMTDPDLTTGSARAYAAACQQQTPPATIVNVQGDAPFIPPEALRAVFAALDAGAQVATPIRRLGWQELDELRAHKVTTPFSGTTCIVAHDGNAIWFSKQIIPAIRTEAQQRLSILTSPVFQHLGLYGYTWKTLADFSKAEPSVYEELEGLEQLRFFDLGIPVRTVEIDAPAWAIGGVDSPADVLRAEQIIARFGDRPWS